jgi:hypothetical protein
MRMINIFFLYGEWPLGADNRIRFTELVMLVYAEELPL